MKKLNVVLILTVTLLMNGLVISSCSEGSKTTPEEEVRNYSKYFVEKLGAKEIDSLKTAYPDIVKADSIMPLANDTIVVAESAPGQYDVILSDGVTLKMTRADDGNIAVVESKGLFAFPADKIEIAKKTGMWDESLNDAALSERLNDEEFFAYLKKSKSMNSNDIIAIGKKVDGSYEKSGYAMIENKTDQPIKGSDYKVIYSEVYFEGMMPVETTKTKTGKDIPPHGSVKYDITTYNRGGEEIKGVKLNLSPQQIKDRFASYTGNEYQEYLKTKK